MRWTPDRDAKLQKLLRAGLSGAQIAERMNVSRCAVVGRKYRLALCEEDTRPPAYSDDEIAAMLALRKAGASGKAVAKALRRPLSSIYTKVSRMGIAS
ncbi:MAG TPA: GcrA family cell cycle regulator [Micropepsaceae bacterium]|nr:GcrA family cell cycle regulator [Micropepsaceae bacterium]